MDSLRSEYGAICTKLYLSHFFLKNTNFDLFCNNDKWWLKIVDVFLQALYKALEI